MRMLLPILLFASSAICAQSRLSLTSTLPLAAGDFRVDNLGNVYGITTDGQIRKYTAPGDSVAAYNETRRYGSLTTVDVTNPLRVLLFYKDFMTVVALDRFFGRLYVSDLRQAQILQASTVAAAYDNNFWVFDEQNAQLKRIGDQGQAVMTSDDFRQLFGESITPEEIVDQGGLVYLNDTARGIYVFDYYGGFKVKLSFKGLTGLRVFGKNIYGVVGGQLFSYQPGTLQEDRLILPPAEKYQIVFGGLYALRKGVLYYYKITGGLLSPEEKP
ncbi:MAG TPA: hypothetical protein VL547_15925 [Dinghuibacter sp.]|uniref:hypothetical protein n=1 Tax=Dinghuibacter sp. TaxID=2024697 RepID=UPI002CC08397|nr:hypothetical protein [Dinghuibacter sp.]HTJ13524.1 hypothetical protein [Dinghuibacter sp.]